MLDSMAETVRRALARGARVLEAGSSTARLDTELLMAHALGVTREALLMSALDGEAPCTFEPLLARRLAHEPVAYITESRDFWTLSLWTPCGVLIPRPDSETLIEAAIAHFTAGVPTQILDLGTGSGALLLAALSHWNVAHGLGIDASQRAIEVASSNAERLGLDTRARFRPGDWAEGLGGTFDLILCNPPYVEADADISAEVREFEPGSALFAGPDGLDAYRAIAPQLAALVAPGGCACIEIGHTQADAAGALFAAQGFAVAIRHDLAGRDRCLVLTSAN